MPKEIKAEMKYLVSSGPQAGYQARLTPTQWKHIFVKRLHGLVCQFVGLSIVFPSVFDFSFLFFSFLVFLKPWSHETMKPLFYEVMFVDGRILPDAEAAFMYLKTGVWQ